MARKRVSSKKVDLSKYDEKDKNNLGTIFVKAHYAILIDHPELLQYSGFSYKYNDTYFKITISYAINNPIEEEINTLKIKTIINQIKLKTSRMSDLEKILYVYNWIGENARYDNLFTYSSKNQSIYNVFIKKNAVCAGFAKTSQVIFQNIGIESMSILGETSAPHMWNITKYQDKYYYFDSTYAASIRDKDNPYYYDGINVNTENYTMYFKEWYPPIESTTILYNQKKQSS